MADKKKEGVVLAIGVGKPKDEEDDFEEETPEEEGFAEEEGEELPPPEEEESEGAYPEFSIPEGLDLSDIEPGEEKEVLCLISKTSDGSACIKQVDGVDLAGLSQGMYGPPPAEPLPPEPPPGAAPPGMLAGGPPMELPPGMPPGMAIMGGPPPEEEVSPVRRRAAAAGLM